VIGGRLDASGSRIGGHLHAIGSEISGVKIHPPTAADIEFARRIVADIDARRLHLDMGVWHGRGWSSESAPGDYCGTSHCIAGAAQCLATERDLRECDALDAGKKIIPNLSYLFFWGDTVAERELRKIAEMKTNDKY
jgi:hypothetical protein